MSTGNDLKYWIFAYVFQGEKISKDKYKIFGSMTEKKTNSLLVHITQGLSENSSCRAEQLLYN